jgi:hypothetical protein
VLHGDAHLGNVILRPDGPVLCDFDSCASDLQRGISPRSRWARSGSANLAVPMEKSPLMAISRSALVASQLEVPTWFVVSTQSVGPGR